MKRFRMVAALTLLAAVASSCGAMGSVGDVLGGGSSVYGEVRSVDTRRGRLQVREQYGRDQTVRFDNRTRVVYQNRQYPVSSLSRGDQVQMRVEYDRNNTAWADRIEVRSSARDNRRGTDPGSVWSTRLQRLDGRVQGVDTRRGYFTITQNRSRGVVVY
ncbi:MAG: hypothetical protein ACREK1_08760, partial [Longimicrobiales bacterium]